MGVKIESRMRRKNPAPLLSNEQRREYETLKREIVKEDMPAGLEGFQRVGKKLLKIRQEHLYREEFGTFDAFCRSIFGCTRSTADRWIVGYQVVQDLAAQEVAVLPDNERVARALAEYPKPDRKLIWERALQIAGRKKPTYQMIREAANKCTSLIPEGHLQKVWVGDLIKRLKGFNHALALSADLSDVTWESILEIAILMYNIEVRLTEISIPVHERMKELEREDPHRRKQREVSGLVTPTAV
jgi:hypothetical protein